MNIRFASLAASLLALSACDRGPPDAADFARRARHMVGHGAGPLVIKSVEAEENILVITVDGPANWRGGNPSFMLTAFALDGFCDSASTKGYFEDGRMLRVDTVEAGRSLIRGTPVTRCRDPQSRIRRNS